MNSRKFFSSGCLLLPNHQDVSQYGTCVLNSGDQKASDPFQLIFLFDEVPFALSYESLKLHAKKCSFFVHNLTIMQKTLTVFRKSQLI